MINLHIDTFSQTKVREIDRVLIGFCLIFVLFISKSESEAYALENWNNIPNYQHENEKNIKERFGVEALELDSNDPRQKLLYLTVEFDHNGAQKVDFDIYDIKSDKCPLRNFEYLGIQEMDIESPFEVLFKTHDIRYKIISTPQDICREIALAAKIGNLKSLIINGHGDPNSIEFSESNSLSVDNINNVLDKNCFSGLSLDAEIILVSCSTGKTETGIANAISQFSQRNVWAPFMNILFIGYTFSKDIPPIPSFYGDNPTDIACVFSPDKSRKCVAFPDCSEKKEENETWSIWDWIFSYTF